MSQERRQQDYSVDIKLDALIQRATQIRADIDVAATSLATVVKEITDVLRQFRDLANIWKFPDINQPRFGEVTRRDEEQTAIARDYLVGQVCTAILGACILALFAVYSFEANILMAVIISLAFAWIAEKSCGSLLRRLVGASPKDRNAVKRVKILLYFFGTITIISLSGFAWLRFVEDEESLALLSLVIVGAEFGSFGLSAAFSCGYAIYRWSKDLDDTHRTLTLQQRDLAAKLGNFSADLVDVEFQIEQMKNGPQTPEREDFR